MVSTTDTSRRSFLRRLGITIGLVGGTSAVAAACGKSANETAAEYEQYKAASVPKNTAPPTAAAATTMNHAAHGGSVADMDAAHEAGVKYFLANAKDMVSRPHPFTMDGKVKVFHIIARALKWEVKPDDVRDVYAYEGVLPGPELRATEGERVRIVFKNELPESSSIHWHGLYTPNGMDGVPFVTQPPVKPGETFTYEFVAAPSGSHMYHSHHNAMEQVGKGLLGAFIVEPKDKTKYPAFDKEYTMVLNDTMLGFTLNGKSFPATGLMTAKLGERVLVRFMNEGLMNHPMHLHGTGMLVVAKDGYPLPQPYMCDVQDVAPGDRYDALIVADNPGAWAFHCHTLSHAESPTGMFGLVTALVVTDPSKQA